MRLKYGGPCSKCNQPIPKDAEADYNNITRKISHYACPEKQDLFSESEAEDTAARCHFIRAGELADDEAVRARWLLWSLLDGSGSETAGRTGVQACPD